MIPIRTPLKLNAFVLPILLEALTIVVISVKNDDHREDAPHFMITQFWSSFGCFTRLKITDEPLSTDSDHGQLFKPS